jgi:type 1 glutamine amidotransferase
VSDGFRPIFLGLAASFLLVACGQTPPSGAASPDAGEPAGPDPAPRPDAAASDRASEPAGLPDAAAPDRGLADVLATDLASPASADAAPSPASILIFTRATAFVHETRGAAAMAIKKALLPFGVTATISEDPALISAEKLAPLGAVVLIDTTGKPFGDPGTAGIDALAAFVRGGRGLVGIHAASSGNETSPTYVGLIGGDFKEHPGSVRLGHCQPQGNHPSVARLPPTFSLVDEFYVFDMYRNDNLVDLRCDALGSATKLPIAWHRQEGQGRVFYTALGHGAEEWSDPHVLDDHVIPGILWTLYREGP